MKARQLGENNPNAKLTNDDVQLMRGFFKSCSEEVDAIDNKIEALIQRRRQLKNQMRRENIADMFGISKQHAYLIIRGEQR